MQIAVADYVRREWKTFSLDSRREAILAGVHCEYLASNSGKFLAFIDVAAFYQIDLEGRGFDTHCRALEIKPRIYSAGALVREVRMQTFRLGTIFANNMHYYVEPVVPLADPLLEQLAQLYQSRVLVWDGSSIGSYYGNREYHEGVN